jgi:heat shock protein 4
MDEIRFIAGPIIQRYKEKVEAEREVIRKAEEAAASKRRAELAAQKATEDAAAQNEENARKYAEGDSEMKDAPAEDKQ